MQSFLFCLDEALNVPAFFQLSGLFIKSLLFFFDNIQSLREDIAADLHDINIIFYSHYHLFSD
jgi:hypothetical protein